MGTFWNYLFGQKHENKNLKQINKYLESFYPKKISHNKHPDNSESIKKNITHIPLNSVLNNSYELQKAKNQTESISQQEYKKITSTFNKIIEDKTNSHFILTFSKNKPSDKKLLHTSNDDLNSDDKTEVTDDQACNLGSSQDVESSGQDSPSAPDFVDS